MFKQTVLLIGTDTALAHCFHNNSKIELSGSAPTIIVKGFWDEEANVWVASSNDVPGLATEGKTLSGLVEKLKIIIPELLDANGYPDSEDVLFELNTQIRAIAHRHTTTA